MVTVYGVRSAAVTLTRAATPEQLVRRNVSDSVKLIQDVSAADAQRITGHAAESGRVLRYLGTTIVLAETQTAQLSATRYGGILTVGTSPSTSPPALGFQTTRQTMTRERSRGR